MLLIEDNRTDIFVITQVLKDLGLAEDLQVVSDGEAALVLWNSMEADQQEPAPRLVLLDLNLPRVSGAEVLKRIRSGRRWADVPVVIVTSSGSPEDLAMTSELNASAYFRKPAELSQYMTLAQIVIEVLPECKAQPEEL